MSHDPQSPTDAADHDPLADDFDFMDDQDLPEDEEGWDCGQFIADGYIHCSRVGSEECGFMCPYGGRLGAKA